MQVIAHELGFRRRQGILEELPRRIVDFKELPRTPAGFLLVDDIDANAGAEAMQGFPEIHPVGFHHKGEGVAAVGTGPKAAP